ncbi:hypothetical protein [Chitiniphilus eburneus]|uniref:hypothetical protein n=1 Tax=Chitiniphilus eburneus TaxID=2571148 RepID=UPI0035CF2821
MIRVSYVEAQALKRCCDLAKRLYVSALLQLVDLRDARVSGPRRLMFKQFAAMVGPVAALGRPMQHEEIREVLRDLLLGGLIESRGTADAFDVVLTLRVGG